VEGKRFIIPIFISHVGCHHRCIYCDQGLIAHPVAAIPTPEQIAEEIERYLKLGARKRKNCQTVQAAFYGGNFTALPLEPKGGCCTASPLSRRGEGPLPEDIH